MIDETLKELITWIKDVSMTQLPVIADEILTWGLISEIIWTSAWFIVGLVIFFVSIFTFKVIDLEGKKFDEELEGIRKNAKNDQLSIEQRARCKEIQKEQETTGMCYVGLWVVIITGLPTSLICVIIGIIEIIYINVAPRLYIIDYIRDMI